MRNESEQGAPLVSCIVIFLNEESFLSQAVESVLAQTYQNWELILVDDGSTDQSQAIAEAYVRAHPDRLRYLTHAARSNQGMSASRNLGIRSSRGRHIAFLDADDVWLPEKIDQQVSLFERFPDAVMICGATQYWRSWDSMAEDRQDIVVAPGSTGAGLATPQDVLVYPPELLLTLHPLGRGASPSTSGFMVTRAATEAVGGFEDRFRGLYEDQAFKAKLYLHGPIYISSHCFDRYRQHADSCVQVSRSEGTDDAFSVVFLKWLRDYLDLNDIHDARISWCLRKRLFRFDWPRLHRLISCLVRTLPRPFGRSRLRRHR